MLILIPFIVIILIIVAVDQIYYSDTKPKVTKEEKVITKDIKRAEEQKNYIDKYIKK